MAEPRVYVENLRDVSSFLRSVEPRLLPIMRNELKQSVTRRVVPTVKRRLPVGPPKGGHAANSIRTTSRGNTVYLVGGGARYPYFGWLEFGGTLTGRGRGKNQTINRNFISRGRTMIPALADNLGALRADVAKAVDNNLRKGLQTRALTR